MMDLSNVLPTLSRVVIVSRRNPQRAAPFPRHTRLRVSLVRAAVAIAAVTVLGAAGDPGDVDRGLGDFRQGRFAEAMQDWRQAAAAGDARGALYVGVLFDTGLGAPHDERQAMDWYRRAADAGSAVGAFNVGVLYDAGLGVPQDPRQAAQWYARAAAGGFARGAYNLAMLYEHGVGVRRDRKRAIALYATAANDGIEAAQMHLAELMPPAATLVAHARPAGHPQGRPQDTAMQAFKQAQDILLDRGPAAAAQAFALFRRAADRRDALAEYDLGYCYERGLGVSRDDVQALGWYRRAAADTTDDQLRSIAETGAGNLEQQVQQAQLHPTATPPVEPGPSLSR